MIKKNQAIILLYSEVKIFNALKATYHLSNKRRDV